MKAVSAEDRQGKQRGRYRVKGTNLPAIGKVNQGGAEPDDQRSPPAPAVACWIEFASGCVRFWLDWLQGPGSVD